MILYVTFGDQPSGIFRSQVMDFVNFLNRNQLGKTRLVAFISIRGFSNNRKKIRAAVPDAIVVPMYPRMVNWKLNRLLLNFLCWRLRPGIVYGRGVLATLLALQARKKQLINKVIYDGRGAISAEWHEYDVVDSKELKDGIREMEEEAVTGADFRIAVSAKLVDYWHNEFRYQPGRETVVPCTLDESYERFAIDPERIRETRHSAGLPEDATLLVYSGSMAGWQSVDLITSLLGKIFSHQQETAVLFLSPESPAIAALRIRYPGRVFNQFVSPEKVPYLLQVGDYGLLVRENSVTNRVASPVKFAEYLACGLKVIISGHIGDYSQIVASNSIGFLDTHLPERLEPVTPGERRHNRELALEIYSKNHYKQVYATLNNLN